MSRLTRVLLAAAVAMTAHAATAQPSEAEDEAEDPGGLSEECRTFRGDLDADLGDVLKAGCEPTLGQMSRLMDNPLGNVAMLFTQVDMYRMTNDDTTQVDAEYQYNYMGIFQFPKGISEDWNLINRVVWTVPSIPLDQDKIDRFSPRFSPSQPPGGGPNQPPSSGFLPVEVFSGRTTGFGDMYYVGLFSPKEPIRHAPGKASVWGLGLDLAFPTASEDILGSGKYSAGPSALYVYLGEKVKAGGLLQQYWSYGGDGDRGDVNLTNLQYLYYYSLNDTTSIGAGPNIIVNWEAKSDDRWTVPIGLGINRTFQFGKVPVRVGVEFHYNVIRPDSVGADWDLRLYVIPAAPSALFGWMQ
jgi:hypothetical protein